MRRLSKFIIDLMADALADDPFLTEAKKVTPQRIERIKDVLLYHPDEFDFEEIAQMAGVSPSTVNRIAKDLVDQGAISKPKKPWSMERDFAPIEPHDFAPDETQDVDDVEYHQPQEDDYYDDAIDDDDQFDPIPDVPVRKPRHMIKQAKPTTMASFIRRRRNLPEDVQREIYWMIHAKDIIDW